MSALGSLKVRLLTSRVRPGSCPRGEPPIVHPFLSLALHHQTTGDYPEASTIEARGLRSQNQALELLVALDQRLPFVRGATIPKVAPIPGDLPNQEIVSWRIPGGLAPISLYSCLLCHGSSFRSFGVRGCCVNTAPLRAVRGNIS